MSTVTLEKLSQLDQLKKFTTVVSLANSFFVPIANVSGYRRKTRTVPEDGKDLNRCFPGNIHGTASE